MATLGTFVGSLLSGRFDLVLVTVVLVVGVLVGYLVGRVSQRTLTAAGVGEAVEGTAFERAVGRLGTSTVSVLAGLFALFVVLVFVVLALTVAAVLDVRVYLRQFINFLPQLFVAALVVVFGLIVADKAEVLVSERLRGVKLPEIGLLALLVKYSIIYIAALLALGQLGVANVALLVLLGAYAFGVVFLGGLACRDLLAASAAGFYLLFAEPIAIGDEVRIDGRAGIVQEVDVFVTHIENDGEEFIVPNDHVFRSGIVRVR
ncbi:mechanosensitive ion channel domain-containing protein [Halococcus sp. AFM35]|uniref:mechanosensitive ion channel domain-containing protein n=1 Tax=Halococcus sp. AFM35 TaxID=3421653 RepID=UPI003EBEB0D0